jgi:hypothetical protein
LQFCNFAIFPAMRGATCAVAARVFGECMALTWPARQLC